jgi:hypothetical protein
MRKISFFGSVKTDKENSEGVEEDKKTRELIIVLRAL